MVHTMMSLIELPLSFMGYALETTAFTLNRAPRISVEMTRYELWFGLWRNLRCRFLKFWGYDAYVKKFQPDKLEPKADKCIFIGYPKQLGTSPISDPEAKCLFLEMGPFSRKGFSRKN